MKLPKLTPLQSRLLASVIATLLVVVIWISFQPHHFVYAAELNPLPLVDGDQSHFGDSLPPFPVEGHGLELEEEIRDGGGDSGEGGAYEPDFAYFDRSLIGRAPDGVDALVNNVKKEMDSNPGKTHNFVLEKSQVQGKKAEPGTGFPSRLEGRGTENTSNGDGFVGLEDEDDVMDVVKRQQGNMVYISVSTCRQPSSNITLITDEPPQLMLYVSTDQRNQKPGPDAKNDLAHEPIPFKSGLATFSVQANSDVYIGVEAPKLTEGWTGNWHYEVAASIDGWYHSYNDTSPFLWLVDTDADSALFISYNLTKENSSEEINDKWAKMDSPFTMYTFDTTRWGMTGAGLERSVCGLKEQFQATRANVNVAADMTRRYGAGGNRPKAQFHITGLNASTKYVGFLAMEGNGTTDPLNVPGNAVAQAGGRVWKQFFWTTKTADSSCQVIFNLKFCTEVAYAVPSSPTFQNNSTGLAALYDDRAAAYFTNFSNSLAQIACDTTGTAQYSLAKTCANCSHDYKEWLCSVLMPRCKDFSDPDPWLIDRNVGTPFPNGTFPYQGNLSNENEAKRRRLAYNQSRNPMIDDDIKPGPYKELLPCEDLCFDIVRSCPAALGFSCPEGRMGEMSYGRRLGDGRNLTCNFPGAVVDLNMFRGGCETGNVTSFPLGAVPVEGYRNRLCSVFFAC
ncbi:stretch-activated Ca2+-permeable channel component-domain-containing protein [Clohesyomyces aquaticus]|uniref:Stretch-activated Ca2+-permeable channel component-domain-containing protein n=1 Tax=Clohesyomyces aquaticus TaxID=1231657 RepID=A0A1Y1ZK36_9PLEO|nr:stretch-activated Ca2+-permeable channel component-domain-containing protein [Clohesyomyces aquaticus]